MSTIKDIFDNKPFIDNRNDIINFIKQFKGISYEYKKGDTLNALTDPYPTPRDSTHIIDLKLSYKTDYDIELYIYLFRRHE